eukprot:scaffold199666_cov24-Tisochrysis_lutea.AAC.3
MTCSEVGKQRVGKAARAGRARREDQWARISRHVPAWMTPSIARASHLTPPGRSVDRAPYVAADAQPRAAENAAAGRAAPPPTQLSSPPQTHALWTPAPRASRGAAARLCLGTFAPTGCAASRSRGSGA